MKSNLKKKVGEEKQTHLSSLAEALKIRQYRLMRKQREGKKKNKQKLIN